MERKKNKTKDKQYTEIRQKMGLVYCKIYEASEVGK